MCFGWEQNTSQIQNLRHFEKGGGRCYKLWLTGLVAVVGVDFVYRTRKRFRGRLLKHNAIATARLACLQVGSVARDDGARALLKDTVYSCRHHHNDVKVDVLMHQLTAVVAKV